MSSAPRFSPSIVTLPVSIAAPPGWRSQSVAAGITRLTGLFVVLRELLRTEAAWMAGVPYWDAKRRVSEHILEEAQHAEAMLGRLHELKAASAEHRQVPGVEELIQAVACAQSGDEWLRGVYLEVKPWLVRQVEAYLQDSDPVMDTPTRALLDRLAEDLRRQSDWFRGFTPTYSRWEQLDTTPWQSYVRSALGAADFSAPEFFPVSSRPARPTGCLEFKGISRVRRDSTVQVTDKSPFPREGGSFAEKRFLVFYNHVQEMQFAESLGAILYETAEMPWAFHHDLARHMADEVRHAEMGRIRLAQLGIALTEIPLLTQHYEFRLNLNSLERFCLMTLVMEATAFERKRANVELFEQNGDAVSALYETYDIRDEMLHTNLGHVWVPILLRVYHDSRSVSELTEHCRGLIAQVITEYPTNAANMIKR